MTSMTSGCRCEAGCVPADIAQLSAALPWNLKNAAAIGLALRFADQKAEDLGHDDAAQHPWGVESAGGRGGPPGKQHPTPCSVRAAANALHNFADILCETLR